MAELRIDVPAQDPAEGRRVAAAPLHEPLKVLLGAYLLLAGIFLAGRLLLLALYSDRVAEAGTGRWSALLVGLRMDTIAASVILVVPAFLLLLAPRRAAAVVSRAVRYYLLFWVLVAIFVECATVPFLAEFDVRPNEIFINYLQYPKEVLGNIWAVYKAELLVAGILLALAVWLFRRWAFRRVERVFVLPWGWRALLLLPVLGLLFLGVRSTLGHRPANLSTAAFSSSRLVNEIAKNSLHSVAYAAYSLGRHGGTAASYGRMPLDEAYDRVARCLRIPVGSPDRPFLRLQATNFPSARPKNLILFLQESLGAQFVEAVGGAPDITPNLNRLAAEGLLFTDLYSNGTRSIRGIAGCTAGILPVPGEGVVKRNRAQRGFFTVASLLAPHGYTSSFIYGGASNFDNMRSWFLGNGFDRVIDEPEFDDARFHGVWGVSDEDLVDRAVRELSALHEQGRPFVSVLFSTTNHTPFEFPAGRIELLPGFPAASPENAIKFADYAIGRLVEKAREAGFYDDTVIVVVADHNVRVYGDDLVPVDMFRIPGLILGGGVEPGTVTTMHTQPDVLATALDLLGLDLEIPVMGTSVYEDRGKDCALMKYHDLYALRRGDTVAVIQPGVEPLTFSYVDRHLVARDHDVELERDALAHVVVLDDIYQNRRYRVAGG